MVFEARELSSSTATAQALKDISIDIPRHQITALIGPSGCGKSTVPALLQPDERPDPGRRMEGEIEFDGEDLYAPGVDPVALRRRIGMVFQKPNPFPKTIYENVAWGPRINGYKGDMDELVERSLRRAALWDEVKDKLQPAALGALRRPAAAPVHRAHDGRRARGDPDGRALLGPRPDRRRSQIEDLMDDLKARVHDRHRHPQHAAGRARQRHDRLLHARRSASERPAHGVIAEYGATDADLHQPRDQRTEAYITGRFG